MSSAFYSISPIKVIGPQNMTKYSPSQVMLTAIKFGSSCDIFLV